MCPCQRCNRPAVAVKSEVVKSTEIVLSEATDNVATKFLAPVVSAAVKSPNETVGAASSSVISS